MKHLALVFLVACGPMPVEVCEGLTGGAARRAEIGTYDENGDFLTYVDGGETPLIFGLQGGYMVTPVVRIPAEASDDATRCFNVRIENELDPPGSAPDLELSLIASAEDGVYTLEGLANFLGNLRRDLIGRSLTMTIEIRGRDVAVDETIQVVLTPDV